MTTNEDILISRFGSGQVRITINRPGKHNALSRPVLARLSKEVASLGRDGATRFIVVQGSADRYFAAGGDLVDLSSVRTRDAARSMGAECRSALDAIRDCEVPVIAYLNGDAIGGGAELALACDMRLMAPSAHIGYIHGKLAITSAWGGGADLCALVGASRALRMMARCEMVDADTALAWGLAEAVIGDGPDGTDMRRFLDPLCSQSHTVMRAIKHQMRARRLGCGYAEQRAAEQQGLVDSWVSPEHWEAVEKILSRMKS